MRLIIDGEQYYINLKNVLYINVVESNDINTHKTSYILYIHLLDSKNLKYFTTSKDELNSICDTIYESFSK